MPRKRRAKYGDYCEVRDGVLYATVQLPVGNGKYKRRRKKVSNKIEARQWALAQLSHGQADGLETFIELVDWYKAHFLLEPVYENGLKVEGVKDWKKSRAKLDRMCHHFGARKLSAFSERDLLGYARTRRSQDKVSTATLNRDFALMRAMFRKGHEADGSIRIPRFPINTSAEVARERIMSFEEEKRILAACGKMEVIKKVSRRTNREHLRAIVILAVDTAMRSGEIFQLDWKDVDLKTGIITIQSATTKTQKTRKVGMTARVKAELEKIKGKGRVFGITSARKAFATACDRAKVKDLHFHDLRHTGTTRMIRAGIPHTEVMKITGHTQIKTFLRYLNLGDTTVQSVADRLSEYLKNV